MGMSKEERRIHKAFIDHEAEREEWALLIGRFMMAFGDIEHITMLAIERSFVEPIMRTASSLLLAKRIDLLTEVLESKENVTEATRKAFLDWLENARKLADMRNLIAHNSLILQFCQDKETGAWEALGVIISARNEQKRVTLKTLEKLVDQAEECSYRLNDAFGYLAYQLRPPQVRKRRKAKRADS